MIKVVSNRFFSKEILMTLQEIKEAKRQHGLTNEMMAQRSGVPLSTVQKVLGGSTASPRKKTLDALASVFPSAPVSRTTGDTGSDAPSAVKESAFAYDAAQAKHTIKDIYALPDGVRAELLDGQLYYMAAPTRTHQRIAGEMFLAATNYIRAHQGACEVYLAPFAVFLFGDDSAYVEPDMTVICDSSRVEENGCVGAPDWVVEIVSPSSLKLDMGKKLFKYRDAGVREYWIIYPEKRMVIAYLFSHSEEAESAAIYSFDDEVPSRTIDGLTIRLADHL